MQTVTVELVTNLTSLDNLPSRKHPLLNQAVYFILKDVQPNPD
jgi:hypothetical protein